MVDPTESPLQRDWLALHRQLGEQMRERFDRDLPMEELLGDRWARAEELGFGPGSSIYHNTYVFGDVSVGEKTWIGPMVMLDGTGGLRIGSTCSISAGVHIYTHDSVKWALSGGKAEYEREPVQIGDCCYIGAQSVIARGVSIGDHSVIGACSFVNRDIPPFTIAAGVPCRAIGHVDVSPDGEISLRYDKQTKQLNDKLD